MRISVAASHVEPIDMRLHGGWGSVAAPPLALDATRQDDGETLCCAVSGAAADGSGDVIALVDSAEPSPSVEARRALCFSKPRSSLVCFMESMSMCMAGMWRCIRGCQ